MTTVGREARRRGVFSRQFFFFLWTEKHYGSSRDLLQTGFWFFMHAGTSEDVGRPEAFEREPAARSRLSRSPPRVAGGVGGSGRGRSEETNGTKRLRRLVARSTGRSRLSFFFFSRERGMKRPAAERVRVPADESCRRAGAGRRRDPRGGFRRVARPPGSSDGHRARAHSRLQKTLCARVHPARR